MLRQEVSEKEFKTDLEKMTVKEKFHSLNNSTMDPEMSSTSAESLSEEAEREAAKSTMVYLKSEKTLDLGKMRATDYKFNKHVYLPRHEAVDKEALHEVRRQTMLNVFRQTASKNSKKVGSKNNKQDSGNKVIVWILISPAQNLQV